MQVTQDDQVCKRVDDLRRIQLSLHSDYHAFPAAFLKTSHRMFGDVRIRSAIQECGTQDADQRSFAGPQVLAQNRRSAVRGFSVAQTSIGTLTKPTSGLVAKGAISDAPMMQMVYFRLTARRDKKTAKAFLNKAVERMSSSDGHHRHRKKPIGASSQGQSSI